MRAVPNHALALTILAALAAEPAAAAAPCGEWRPMPEEETRGDALLPAGVAAGAVRTDRATIVAHTPRAATVVVHYSSGPQCPPSVSAPARSTRRRGYNAHIALLDLLPATTYRYQVEVTPDDARGPPPGPGAAGWFRTAPVNDVPVRLAFSADISNDPLDYVLFDDLAAIGAEIYLSLGDWPYADARPIARTLREYREKHREIRRVREVRDLLRAVPMLATWDDHEVKNDWDGADAVDERDRVRFGRRTWFEWFPVHGAPRGEVYRRHPWGKGVELFWLDCRGHRDANRDRDEPGKTMLGATQLRWLQDSLVDSEAPFKLVITSVPLDYGTTRKDYWGGGFTAERDALLQFILDRGISGVVFLTADQHWLAVHHLQSGFKEFQVGALAQFPRTPGPAPPWVPIQRPGYNFGVIDYAPAVGSSAPTLTFSAWTDDLELLYTETVIAGRGAIEVLPASPATSWTLTGAHTYAGRGPATLHNAPPGEYTIHWTSVVPGLPPLPTQQEVLADGGALSFTETLSDVGTPLWKTAFDAPTPTRGWELDDQEPPRLVRRGVALRAGPLAVRLEATGKAEYGVMWGITAPDTWHRVLFTVRLGARLERSVGGVLTTLDLAPALEPPRRAEHVISVSRDGATQRVWLDGAVILTGPDAADAGAPGVGLVGFGTPGVDFVSAAGYPTP